MNCNNCNNNEFYKLENNYIKCKKCAKKHSLKKLKLNEQIIKQFIKNNNANEASMILSLNYRTIKNRYDEYRYKISKYLEDEYNNTVKDNSQYEEYYYFNERQKRQKQKSLYEAINIIGFNFNEKVYTLLMPKLQHQIYNKDIGFEKYLNWRKIHSQDSFKTNLNEFWSFLDDGLKKYKGFNEDSFFFYLKECEFKFNYTKEEQLEILKNL